MAEPICDGTGPSHPGHPKPAPLPLNHSGFTPRHLHVPPASPGLPQTPRTPPQPPPEPPGIPHLIQVGVRSPPGAAPAGVQQVQAVEPHQPLGQPGEGSVLSAQRSLRGSGVRGADGHLSAVSKATVMSWAQTAAAAVWGSAEAMATASVGPRTGSSTSRGPGAWRDRGHSGDPRREPLGTLRGPPEGAPGDTQGTPKRSPRAPSPAPLAQGHPPAPAGSARLGPPPRSAWGDRNDAPPPAVLAVEPGKPGQEKSGVPMSGDPSK